MENNNIIKVLVAIIVIFILTTVVLMVKVYNPAITGNVVKSSSGNNNEADKPAGGILANLPLKDKNGNSIVDKLTGKSTTSATSTVSSKDTINNLIELKTASKNKDTIRIAELVTLVNRYIDENNDNTILNSWQKNVVGCVYQGNCPDPAYLQVIDTITSANLDNKNSIMIHGVIETANLWNSQNLVIFSDSLTNTNRLIKENGNVNIKDQWNDVVVCNGVCSDFQNKIFNLVKTINTNS